MAAVGAALLLGCGACGFGCTCLLLGGDGARARARSPRREGSARGRVASAFLHARVAAGAALARMRALLARHDHQEVAQLVPTMLDIVTLGLSAGLSFDASLELYCERFDNALSAGLSRSLLRWRVGGLARAEGLRRAADELGEPSLGDLADVVEEALELGLPLASSLERQAGALRARQRAATQEEIERLPVRMLIPLGTLIVPAMLLAILGPLLGFVAGVG